MKIFVYIFIFISLMLFCSCVQSQKKETTYHPIVLKAKETSLYTERVNWEKVNSTFSKLIEGKETVEDQKKALQFLINSLGDKHASFRSPEDYSIIVSYTGERPEGEKYRATDIEFHNTVINDINAEFSYRLLDDGVGYLKVVGIGPGDVKAQADVIRNGLISLKAKGVSRWIVDLRYNGGGNMAPMVSGLAPLIGEGFIGGSINNSGDVRTYEIKNGEFYNYDQLVCTMNNLPTMEPVEKVVVLLSRYTVSSGEILAIAFKGRKHTTFIGEASGGLTTGNGFDVINKDLALVISQGVFIDRDRKAYNKWVEVDETSEFQHRVALKDDNQIKRAIAWLTN